MSERPGFMFYYEEINPVIETLDDGQLGQLLRAIVAYAQCGEIIELDGITRFAFSMFKPKLDRDAARYEKVKLHSQYMVYCRSIPEGEKKLSETEWIASQQIETGSDYQLLPDDHQPPTSIPTAISSPVTSTSPSSTPFPASSTSPAAATAGKSSPPPSRGSVDLDEYERLRLSWRPY